jgi:hypothetical protein
MDGSGSSRNYGTFWGLGAGTTGCPLRLVTQNLVRILQLYLAMPPAHCFPSVLKLSNHELVPTLSGQRTGGGGTILVQQQINADDK